MIRRRIATLAVFAASALLLAACAQGDPVLGGPPVGEPLLPDLVPAPPIEIHTIKEDDGRSQVYFTSTLVNVGDADFLLSGTRQGDTWIVDQEIPYSESGVEIVSTEAEMAWGGDGHDHWHVSRVAVYWLEALDESGQPVEDFEARYDTKVGFCFYDSNRELMTGPRKVVYDSAACGLEDATAFRVGLSRGWSDIYDWSLPGQSIDISDLPDGPYRLWAEADQQGWFREITRDNNLTWVDLELVTVVAGARLARLTDVGPSFE